MVPGTFPPSSSLLRLGEAGLLMVSPQEAVAEVEHMVPLCVFRTREQPVSVTGMGSSLRNGASHAPQPCQCVSALSAGAQSPIGYPVPKLPENSGDELEGEELVECRRGTYRWPHGPWQSWVPQRSARSGRAWWPWWALDASLALFTLRLVETSVREGALGCRTVPPQCHAPGEAPPWALGEAAVT